MVAVEDMLAEVAVEDTLAEVGSLVAVEEGTPFHQNYS